MKTREQLQQEMTSNEMTLQKMSDRIADLKDEKAFIVRKLAIINENIQRKERIKLRNQTINKYIAENLL